MSSNTLSIKSTWLGNSNSFGTGHLHVRYNYPKGEFSAPKKDILTLQSTYTFFHLFLLCQ